MILKLHNKQEEEGEDVRTKYVTQKMWSPSQKKNKQTPVVLAVYLFHSDRLFIVPFL